MWAGMYGLDLYCEKFKGGGELVDEHGHRYNEFPHQYTNELGSVCRAQARRDGWIIRNDGTAICPKCSGKGGQRIDKARETE